MGSRQLTSFAASASSGTPKLERARPSGGFRVPSPTTSDEEEIEAQEKRALELISRVGSAWTQANSRSSTIPQSEYISSLGDSGPLSSEVQKDSLRGNISFEFGNPRIPLEFAPLSPPNMVVEREPPKATPQKATDQPSANLQQPQFGQPSPLRNRLQQPQQSVFNIPRPYHQRPEHHRSIAPAALPQSRATSNGQPSYARPSVAPSIPPSGSAIGDQPSYTQSTQHYQRPVASINGIQPRPQPTFVHPFQQPLSQPSHFQNSVQSATVPPTNLQGSANGIPRPANAPTWSGYPRAQPTFSAYGPGSGRGYIITEPQNPIIDLTGTSSNAKTSYDPPGLFDDRFGATDPYLYLDAGKAAENIKALLEGAFEDDEDKPRTRGRKKDSHENSDVLTDKLKSLDVKGDEDEENIHKQGEDGEENEEDEDDGTIEGLKIKLLPHQVEGVDWMRDKEIGVKKKNRILPKGGILADDMGLGKTIQSISLILTNPRPSVTAVSTSTPDKKALPATVGKSTLVVAPLALIKQWEAEIRDRVEDSHRLRVLVHHGPARTKSFQDLKKYDVVITTYQILVSEYGSSSSQEDGPQAGCFGIHWYRVILDEAHSIKNCNAKSTKACYALRSEYRWCLTGTPMQNNLDELQSLIRFLRIKPYNDITVWRDQITRPMSQGRGGVAIKRLQFYLKAFMKRRTKEVLKKEGALNPGGKVTSKDGTNNGFKITQRKVESLLAEFSPEERLFYDRLEQRTDERLEAMMDDAKMSYASALVLLLRLRQACNHPKLLGGSLSKDNDALTTGQSSPSKKSGTEDRDIDEMADLLGGLSVHTKQCDVCQIDLPKEDVSAGLIRCSECETDIVGQLNRRPKPKSRKPKKTPAYQNTEVITKSESQPRRAKIKSNVILDSDEEEEGDWVVPQDQRQVGSLEKAGGSDDENAEGGGESLASSDTETGDESSVQILGSHQRKVIDLETDDETEDSSDPNSAEEEQDEDSEDEDSPESKNSLIASAKIRHLLAILRKESSTHKFIVYSQFTSMLDLIEPFLKNANLLFTRYDGSMRNDAREASLEKLRHDPRCRILLCSLKCGSLGLNLTAASRVVILEPFWNPFVEEQAIDRVHRLNQTVDVVVYKLTIKDTVEARILELQEKKRALANAAIEGKAVAKLSMKDILNLFKRDAEHDLRHEQDSSLGRLDSVLTGNGAAVASDIRDVRRGNSSTRRVTPPVVGKGKGLGYKGEDSVYGRRW